MDKVTQLKTDIATIEEQAEQAGSDKDILYGLLIKAYYMQKDIIVLMESTIPTPEKVIDTDQIDQLTFQLKELKGKFAIEEAAKDVAMAQIKNIMDIVCTIKS